MNETWYNLRMPRICDITPHFDEIKQKISSISGVKSIFVWGSVANKINQPQFRVKDLDILIETNLFSEDFLSIDKKVLSSSMSPSDLENDGFDPQTIKFTNKIININNYNLDKWIISSDNKLLHWGPIFNNKEESDIVSKEAENYADKLSGISKQRIHTSSSKKVISWYNNYVNFIEQQFEDVPQGWYQSDETNIEEIKNHAIKLF